MTQKTSSSFTICHIFALEVYYLPVLLSVRALLARSPKRNKREVVSGSRVTLPENFAYKPGLSFNPGSRVTLPPCKQGLTSPSCVIRTEMKTVHQKIIFLGGAYAISLVTCDFMHLLTKQDEIDQDQS